MIPFEDPKIEAYFYNKVSDQQREQLLIIREAVLTCGIDCLINFEISSF